MDECYVPMELFRQTVLDLMDGIISAQKEAWLAKTMAGFPPGTPEATRQQLLGEVEEGFEAARRKLHATPAHDVLKALREFVGPIQ